MEKILIYGYGNPGRRDDGLGAHFTELIDKWASEEKISNISTDCNYQLNIEDAEVISRYDTVVFVDASMVEDIEDFRLEAVKPDDARIEFTMHAVSVAYVVHLCNKLYNKFPGAYVLHIKACDFGFAEGITDGAKRNMNAALDYMKGFLKKRAVCGECRK